MTTDVSLHSSWLSFLGIRSDQMVLYTGRPLSQEGRFTGSSVRISVVMNYWNFYPYEASALS